MMSKPPHVDLNAHWPVSQSAENACKLEGTLLSSLKKKTV